MMTFIYSYDICADNIFVMKKRIKLKEFADLNNISYRTALRHWKAGLIEGVQNGSGAILVSEYFDVKASMVEKPVKALLFVRCTDENLVADYEAKLKFFAKELGVESYDIIVWDGYSFQGNPHIVDILEKNYNYIIVDRITDIFGVNHKALMWVCEEKDITVKTLNTPASIGSNIYEFYLSAVSLAKAAVGMNAYKKRLFDSATNLFS
jgi:predicted site-specific integrase-resolvase